MNGPHDVEPTDHGEDPADDDFAPDEDDVDRELVRLAPTRGNAPADKSNDEAEGESGDATGPT